MKGLNRLHSLRMDNDAAGFRMAEQAAPQAVAAFNLFQTPESVAVRMVALLDLTPGARILEPSAGLAVLVKAALPHKPREVVAVELAAECSAALFAMDLPGVTLKQGDFLAMEPEQLGTFDAVIMNPPFHLRADIRHIGHAFRFLKPGGRMVALCMANQIREKALRDWADSWEVLPARSFAATGTGIDVALLTKKTVKHTNQRR